MVYIPPRLFDDHLNSRSTNGLVHNHFKNYQRFLFPVSSTVGQLIRCCRVATEAPFRQAPGTHTFALAHCNRIATFTRHESVEFTGSSVGGAPWTSTLVWMVCSMVRAPCAVLFSAGWLDLAWLGLVWFGFHVVAGKCWIIGVNSKTANCH